MAKEGIVCCFDILGYQNIMRTNQIEYVSKLISEKICLLPKDTQNIIDSHVKGVFMKAGYNEDTVAAVQEISKKIKYLLISDTILIYADMSDWIKNKEVTESLKAFFQVMVWTLFLQQIAALQRISFDAGLPIRGAVDYGEFYINSVENGNIFAGKPIVDCYRLSQKLDFAGCAFTEKAGKLLIDKIVTWNGLMQNDLFPIFKEILVPYLVPLKDLTYKRLLLVDWLTSSTIGQPKEFRQYINTAFHDHNKEINDSVVRKMENTERILRWLQERKWVFDEKCLEKSMDE